MNDSDFSVPKAGPTSPSSLGRPRSFQQDWAKLADITGIQSSWAHGGVVASDSGRLIGFHAGQVVSFDRDGQVTDVVATDLTEGHGITLVEENETELLWLCDPGFLFMQTEGDGEEGLAGMFGKGLSQVSRGPRVVKMSLAGQLLMELPLPPVDPDLPHGPTGVYCPCGTAVAEERFGGSGDIWVADGYGSSLVHRFDRFGRHLGTLSGEEGAGHFACPHSVYIDRRQGKRPELYVADRSNQRVQVYDLEGQFLRFFGEGFLNSPSGFVQWGDYLVVAELYGRLAALDSADRLVGYIAEDPDCHAESGWPTRPGWPNAIGSDGRAMAPDVRPGRLNSPHSVTVDASGSLFVSEWLIGGRYAKLDPQ